jgi:Chitobiase/beta-hexosaminidase C-terminal domain/Legume lectin domain
MKTGIPEIRGLAAVLLLALSPLLQAQVNVTTYHNDVSRTGQNTLETILTPANVNSTQFGKLFSIPLDGVVYAQPLYLSAVTIAGGTHNVLYVTTEHDSVYAFDADTGTLYAHVSLIPAGGSTVNSDSDLGCGDLVPEVGITGTPVIDPVAGILYVVASSKVNGSFVQYLHALSVTTLTEMLNGPMSIQAAVPGTGYDAVNGSVIFNTLQENQRAALLLENGHVVIGWSSHCDNDPWHGWVMSYNAKTLAQEAVFNTSPNGEHNGVWMSGGGAAADANGNIYFATGNGTWNGTTDYGDSVVKLGPPANNNFPVVDYFTPYNQNTLATDDTDLASGGLVLLPTLASGQQLLAQQGKQGTIYLLNINNLGKYCVNLTPACTNSDTNVAQEIMGASPGIWGSPAYWNGNLYWTGANDSIKAYSFNANNSGLISLTPTSQSAQIFAFSAPTPAISSNGNTNAILWALDGSADDSTCDGGGSNCLGLYAYDATNLTNLLYSSSQAANNRDSPGIAVKFEKPIIANGKVYVGTQSSVTVYGLLKYALPVAAAPTFSPAPGSYTSAQTVTLSDTTPGAVIYYTTNGTTPSVSSPVYSQPLQIAATTTIEAVAVASGYSSSPVVSGPYLLTLPASVSLAAVDDVSGIAATGTAVTNGGIDRHGNAYSAALLGTSISWAGATFALGTAGVSDAVSNTTIPLPAGNYTTLDLLGTAVNANQVSQTFSVNYSDGTSASFTQSMSDWTAPQNYAGESVVSTMASGISSTGALQKGPYYVYGYSFAIDSAKTAISITLPKNRNVVILAVDVSTAAEQLTSSSGLNLVGGATEAGGVLNLTNGTRIEAHAVWSATPVDVQNFSTDFTFQITPAAASIADGFTFTVQNAGPTARGASGGSLGYAGIGSSVAIKFDLYSNAGEGSDSTGFYTDGAAPTVPALNLTPSGVNLHSGDVMHAHITYNATTLTLTLTDTVTGASFSASQAINIPATVGASTAYVGFTAGTGMVTSVQQILSWTYTSGLPVVNNPDGFASTAGLTLTGVTLAGGMLQLTDGGTDEANSVWTAAPVNVQNFTSDFSFQEIAANADGFTFAIQNAGANAVGQNGGGLAYAGIGSSVAIKFDLYNNAGEGTDSTGFYTDGAYPSVPAIDMTASGVNLLSGDVLHAHITYNGTTLALTLTDTVTGASFTTSQAINIPTTVGANTAYVGFTGATGGESAIQQIVNWTYVVN